ncbi:acyl-CoA dehydrogenase [Verticiella sediminum]|uniref:Acyl-CoA dehydrogenase n=1 Tax=Verticiella sediminum TaxID=1247510 RepID=A0A556ALY8_9BURK|nr:acyl-CoA dehydrogenase [Verticiella sediminum]TSH93903.1 acyl-CoA dehydrogenase [Verticiella sediminum]
MSLLLSRRDLSFMLYDWLAVESLCERPRYADHSRETFEAALDTSEAIATDKFAPHNRKSDLNEPTFDGERVHMIPEVGEALRAFCDAGLMAAAQDYDLGGMQLPTVVDKACMAWFMAANIGTAAYPFLSIGNANLLLAHGTPAQIDAFVRPQMTGQFLGTMCLSEPQAGSSLSDVATRAVPDAAPDAAGDPLGPRYRLFGNKMWISAGEHELSENIVHLVLAKIPGPDGKPVPGVKGLSLFAVPKRIIKRDGTLGERNDVVLAGLNHKMGYRGTTNTLLNFGEGRHRPGADLGLDPAAGAIGWLVGQPGQGLAAMFHMMNEARIGVGLGATVLGYTGYLHALEYARNRPQGRLMGPAGKNAAAPQVPIVRHPDVRRMLLAQKAYVEGALGLNLYCARLVDDQHTHPDEAARAEAELLLDILTPIAKSWPSQWCLHANSLAIQVHGGYGYTRDYPVEQFYRDNRLNPIHEGTHGIQGLDLLGRKVVMQNGAALAALEARLRRDLGRAQAGEDAELQGYALQLDTRWRRLLAVTRELWDSGDPLLTLANASVYLEAFGHVVLAWVWLQQAMAVKGDDDFAQGKRQACRYFFAWELPSVDPQLDLLASLDTTTLDMQEGWF